MYLYRGFQISSVLSKKARFNIYLFSIKIEYKILIYGTLPHSRYRNFVIYYFFLIITRIIMRQAQPYREVYRLISTLYIVIYVLYLGENIR